MLSHLCLSSQVPNWSVNSANYTLDASLIATLNIDGNISSDTEDIVAVFDENDGVRGVAKVSFNATLNKYIIFLTYFSHTSGDKLKLKVYDASADKIIDASNLSFEFTPFTINGTNDEPFNIIAENAQTPKVVTKTASNVANNSATLNGEIVSNGSSNIIEKGILYSTTNPSPRITDTSNITKVVENTAGSIISETISGLNTVGTVYYFRAFATNNSGTAYGEVKRFSLNNALNFKKSNSDRVNIPSNSDFNFANGLTIEAWIKPTSLDGNPTVFSRFSGGQKAFACSINSDGTLQNMISTSGINDVYYNTQKKVKVDTWQHIAFTFDGSEIKCYINGSDAKINGSVIGTPNTIFNSNAPIEIGAKNGSNTFEGEIDEIRIWTRTLTKEQINNNKNKNIPSNASNLVAYYKCNQGVAKGNNASISNLTDSSSKNNAATLVNFNRIGIVSNFVEGVNGSDGQTEYAINEFTTNGNWSDTGNWSQGFVPNNLQNVCITNGVTVIIDVDDLSIDNFVLENGATINIPKDKEITITGTFSTDGNLDVASDKNTSGVLFLKGSTDGKITYKRGGLLANKWSIVTPPVSGQTVKTFVENVANDIRVNTVPDPDRYAIGYYDDNQTAGSKWQYYNANVSASTEFIAGNSYAISRATDGEVSFTGTLTVNNLAKTLIANQWNAIGNPFTTYYPANKNGSSSFLKDNMDVLDDVYKSLYIWDNDQGKYVAVTELDASDRSLPPGQGFFIFMKAGQTEINFKEAKRSAKPSSGTTSFARSSNPEITLTVSTDKTSVKTYLKYFENTKLGLDPGYDIGNFNGASLDVFTHLLENGNNVNYTIQSLPNSNHENRVIPVGLKASKGTEITFTAEVLNLPNGIDTYLEDREKNVFTKLSETNSNYTTVLENDINTIGRFYIHTTNRVLSTDSSVSLSNVSMYNTNNTLKIHGLENQVATITIYSLIGKEVYNTKFTATGTTPVILPKVNTGIYIAKLKTDKGQLTKKIILK